MSASISEDVNLLYCFLPVEDLNVKLEKANQAATGTGLTILGPGYFCFCFLDLTAKGCLSYMATTGNKN